MGKEKVGQENIIPRNRLNRYKYRGRNFGLTPFECIKLIAHYEEKYRRLKEVLNEKDALISNYTNTVKLPKEVSDWLIEKSFISLKHLEVDLIEMIITHDEEEEDDCMYDYLSSDDEALTNLIDAYRYGWEVK